MGRRKCRRLAPFYLGLAFQSAMSAQRALQLLTWDEVRERWLMKGLSQAIGREVLP